MRTFVSLCAGIVIGVAIGGIPDAGRVSALQARLAESRDRRCESNDFSGVVGGMLEDAGRRNAEGAAPPPDPRPAREPEPPAAPAPDTDPAAEVAAAKTALELRRTQARAALIEDVGLDEEALARFDDAAAAMNDELLALTEDFVADVQQNGEPSRRDAMVYAAEALDILITAEDRMASVLDEDQRAEAAEESLDPLSYVDPAIVDTLRVLRPPRRGP